MGSSHELEIRVDGRLVETFVFGGEEPEGIQRQPATLGTLFGDPEWEEYMLYADADMKVRFPAQAGPRVVGVTFVRKFTEPEGVLQPGRAALRCGQRAAGWERRRRGSGRKRSVRQWGPRRHPEPESNLHMPPRSRRPCWRRRGGCARDILASLARRAYRRPLESHDLGTLMEFYRAGRGEAGFDGGVQLALERLLIFPDFLFRIERDPVGAAPDTVYALSDLELASRLSFFLWSSLPDDELLDVAERGRLSDPAVLETQTRRMLADPRSGALVRNFVGLGCIFAN